MGQDDPKEYVDAGRSRFPLALGTLEENEAFIDQISYLQRIAPSAASIERNLRVVMEERELELNRQYVESFQKVNAQIQSFMEKIHRMSSMCHELTNRIQANKERTRELLSRTNVLQSEKKTLSMKQEYLDEFFSRYSLSPQEEGDLEHFISQCDTQGVTPDQFFKALKRLGEVLDNVTEKLKLGGEDGEEDSPALVELSTVLNKQLDAAMEALQKYIQRECRFLNVEIVDMKPTLGRAFEFLHSLRPALVEAAMGEYASARSSHLVRALVDALTKGGKGRRPIEQASSDPPKYVAEMLMWVHNAVLVDRELVVPLLKGSSIKEESTVQRQRKVLSNITESVCQPLKLRLEQVVMRETSPILLLYLSNIFIYYLKAFEAELDPNSVLIKLLSDLHELSSSLFYGSITSNMQRILANVGVPDYDLLPVNSVQQALLMLRDLLESLGGDAAVSMASIDKKELHLKILTHILDPLHQTIQLVCSNLHNQLDVAVYMLNCLNAIRSVVILYPFTEAKLEMLKAQIEANEDVLVSEQASMVLTDNKLMEIYTKCVAHQANQGPLSKIAGMEGQKIASALATFNDFLERGPRMDELQCSQAVKISSARIRESVQMRTIENVISAYQVIHSKVVQPENGYTEEVLGTLKSVEMIKSLLPSK